MRHRKQATVALVAALLSPPIVSTSAGAQSDAQTLPQVEPSTWVGTFEEGPRNETVTVSDGDLWPTCWAANDSLYTAWGDGVGFDLSRTHNPESSDFVDLGVARVDGQQPDRLTGENLALKDEVLPMWQWDPGSGYYRKPTGMLCDGNTLYLAIHKMDRSFGFVQEATVAKSTDGGHTWTNPGVMFDGRVFTTMWFADMGQGGAASPDADGYVYVYGLDGNWRVSPRPDVADPVDVFLARVPRGSVDQRSAWQFYTGTDGIGQPQWSSAIGDKAPVLHDERRIYSQFTWLHRNEGQPAEATTLVGQGGVTYNPVLERYVMVSWSEWSHHYYESPTPWGPWRLLADRDLTANDFVGQDYLSYAGYGTSLVSKFTSADGRTMWVQSNRCCGVGDNHKLSYGFSMRPIQITPSSGTALGNAATGENLALRQDAVPVFKSVEEGDYSPINDGLAYPWVSDSDREVKTQSFWGVTWPLDVTFNTVSLTTGPTDEHGGAFAGQPRVQVRVAGAWVDATGVSWGLTTLNGTSPRTAYRAAFPPVTADGVRVLGTPSGDWTYTSVADVAVQYSTAALADGGLENSTSLDGSPWSAEGGAYRGIDTGVGLSHTGVKNAWLRTSNGASGRQYLTQQVAVQPGATYTLSAWLRTSATVQQVALGARWAGGETIATATAGAVDQYRPYSAELTAPAGVTELTVVVGMDAPTPGVDYILQVDDVVLSPAPAVIGGLSANATVAEGSATTVTVSGATGYQTVALSVEDARGATVAQVGDASLVGGSGSLVFEMPAIAVPPASADSTWQDARYSDVRLVVTGGGATLGVVPFTHDRERQPGELLDGGFEAHENLDAPSPWQSSISPTAGASIDTGIGLQRTGNRNGWIRTGGLGAVGPQALTQEVRVTPGVTYEFSVWVRSVRLDTVLLGASWSGGESLLRVGPARDEAAKKADGTPLYDELYYRYRTTFTPPVGTTQAVLTVGFDAVDGAVDYAMQLDDASLVIAKPNHNRLVDPGLESARDLAGEAWAWEGHARHGLDGPELDLGYVPEDPVDNRSCWNLWTGGSEDYGPNFLIQTVRVEPDAVYDFSAMIRTRDLGMPQWIGARWTGGQAMSELVVYDDWRFRSDRYVQRAIRFHVPPGVDEVTVLVGWDPPGDRDYLMQIDDLQFYRVA